MADSYKKDLLGFQDIYQDLGGTGKKFSRETSTGARQQISGMNAKLNPILLATRTLEMYDGGILNAEEVDGAITSICANLAGVEKFDNEDELNKIESAGSGTIISVLEREKLNNITDTGSGVIITEAERTSLFTLVGLNQDQVDAIERITTIVPVGSILLWPVNIPPDNFLECNGQPVSRDTYETLFNVIGTDYGEGNGTNTFNIPDLRGRFARGWNHGTGADPAANEREDRGDGTIGDNLGTLQDDEIDGHTHEIIVDVKDNVGAVGDTLIGGSGNRTPNPVYTSTTAGGSENRPLNINMMFIIRFGV